MATQQRSNTWSAVVSPWAAKLNLTPQLASIRVADILSGGTCSPIGLKDFEGYLTFKEYSVQNLQFVVWYQDYRKRYLEATHDVGRDNIKVSAPNRASIERRVVEGFTDNKNSLEHFNKDKELYSEKQDRLSTLPAFPPAALISPSSKQATIDRRDSASFFPGPGIHSSTLPEACVDTDSSHGPSNISCFQEECLRIVATFLNPDSSKELNLEAVVRESIVRDVAQSTHPDVFIHAYNEAYDTLENVSLRSFITHGASNVNFQKQMYHYIVSLILWHIGLGVALALIMSVPTLHLPHNRAWRLFSIPWIYCATTTFFSSFRGFCSQVGDRGNFQLRAWELEDYSDEEAKIFVDATPRRNSTSEHSLSFPVNASNIAAISPFARDSPSVYEKQFAVGPSTAYLHPKPIDNESEAHKPLPRPPIFGPERPVEDPRVKALHRHLLAEMHVIALISSLVFGAIIFSVPNGHSQ